MNSQDTSNSFCGTLLPPEKKVWASVMFLYLCVILFTGGGLHPGWICILGDLHPGESAYRWCLLGGLYLVAGRGGGGLGRSPHQILWDMVNEWVVRILLEYILV